MSEHRNARLMFPPKRHPSVMHFEPLFEYAHLPEHLRDVSETFAWLASKVVHQLPDGPELSACLRKLLEAKDCAVRAAMLAHAVD